MVDHEQTTEAAIELKQQIRQARKKFIALASSYFLGVFNDNFFKQAICLLAVSIGQSHFQGNATIIFSLPFLLFAAPAGWLSDKYSKRSVVVWCKGIEILAMAIGAYGLLYDSWLCIFMMLFIMATQSTMVSPALNGTIPELYPSVYVTKANSFIKLVSTSAILIGIALAGPMIDMKSAKERPSVLFTAHNVSESATFLALLQESKEDPIAVSLLSHLPKEVLEVSPSETLPVWDNIFKQISSAFAKTFSLQGAEEDAAEKRKQDLKNSIADSVNQLIQTEENKGLFTISDKEYQVLFQKYGQDEEYATLLSRKNFLGKKYEGYLTLTGVAFTGKLAVAIGVCLVAVLGWLVSLFIPHFSAAATKKKFPFSGPIDTVRVLWELRKDYLLAWTLLGSAFFYSVANLLVLNVNSLGVSQFRFGFMNTSLLVVCLLAGICIGSLLAGAMAKEHNWYKLLPPALFVMGVFNILIYFAPEIPASLQYTYLAVLMVISGTGGGVFIIPMESFCQIRPAAARKGEILAAHNFIDFAGLLLSGFIFTVLSEVFTLQSSCMAFLGISIIVMSIVIFIAFQKVTKEDIMRKDV